MKASFSPNGSAQLYFCNRCEEPMLEKLLRFGCIQGSGILIKPKLHPECWSITKRECFDKIERTIAAMKQPNPLSAVVEAIHGFTL